MTTLSKTRQIAQTPSSVAQRPLDAAGALQAVHRHLDALRDDATATGEWSQVCASLDRIVAEHSGMAEELLSVYEQLGVVFEMTGKLPGIHRESEVLNLYLDCLRRSFSTHEVFITDLFALSEGISHKVVSICGDWLDKLIFRAKDSGNVFVEQTPIVHDDTPTVEVMVGPIFAGESFICAIVLVGNDTTDAFRACDMLLLESLNTFCGDLIRSIRLVQEVQDMSLDMVRALVNAVDQKDEYTSGHSVRVGYFATLLGRAAGLKNEELKMLRWGALLHDVGKIGIRDDVLKKEGKLTEEEFDHIKEHPVRSYTIVQEVPQLVQALDGVRYHHERFDGKGYPEGLAGEDIPFHARIIQIADVFDALTSNRSYRKAFTWQKALDILAEGAGQSVDPSLQTVFDRLIRERLEDRPDGWETLIATANQFARTAEDDMLMGEDE